MKIHPNQVFINLKGEPINSTNERGEKTSLTLGVVLGEMALTPHKQKNGFRPLKGYELAKKFYDKKIEVEIDNADYIQLKELVENSDMYPTIIIAQTLEMLENSKEIKK